MNLVLSKPLILASQSPRRKELLALIGLPFEVDVASKFIEFTPKEIKNPQELVRANALGKVDEVKQRHTNAFVLGVDTVVSIKGETLGKPNSPAEATEMLTKLQGEKHTVWTGVSVLDTDSGKSLSFEEETEVEFFAMTAQEISDYIATGEPMDKAGAYAIQGLGTVHIRGIRGDFFNVVGLPLSRLMQTLKEMV